MRTLAEIMESAKSGEMPTQEECYYALLVYEFMFHMCHRSLREALLSEKPLQKSFAEIKVNNSHDMYRKALSKSPKDYIGWNNDPHNPEYQKQRKISLKLLDKAMKGKLIVE